MVCYGDGKILYNTLKQITACHNTFIGCRANRQWAGPNTQGPVLFYRSPLNTGKAPEHLGRRTSSSAKERWNYYSQTVERVSASSQMVCTRLQFVERLGSDDSAICRLQINAKPLIKRQLSTDAVSDKGFTGKENLLEFICVVFFMEYFLAPFSLSLSACFVNSTVRQSRCNLNIRDNYMSWSRGDISSAALANI